MSLNPVEEHDISCPHCGEVFPILVDQTLEQQDYIEDCYVCCKPIRILISIDFDADQDRWGGAVSIATEADY